MKIQVTYIVPVTVTVDVEEAYVDSVIVNDEDVKPVEGLPVHAVTDMGIAAVPADDPRARIARALADHADWPAWRFGS